MNLGFKLRELRKARGLTQKDLGDMIHKSSQVISNLERGYTLSLDALDIAALANALNVSPSELFQSDNEKAPAPAPTPSPSSPTQDLLKNFLEAASPETRARIESIKISKNGEIIDNDVVYSLPDAQKKAFSELLLSVLEAANHASNCKP